MQRLKMHQPHVDVAPTKTPIHKSNIDSGYWYLKNNKILKLKKISYCWFSTCTKFIEVEWMNSQSNLEETDEEYKY